MLNRKLSDKGGWVGEWMGGWMDGWKNEDKRKWGRGEAEKIKEYRLYYCIIKKNHCWCEEIGNQIISLSLLLYTQMLICPIKHGSKFMTIQWDLEGPNGITYSTILYNWFFIGHLETVLKVLCAIPTSQWDRQKSHKERISHTIILTLEENSLLHLLEMQSLLKLWKLNESQLQGSMEPFQKPCKKQ